MFSVHVLSYQFVIIIFKFFLVKSFRKQKSLYFQGVFRNLLLHLTLFIDYEYLIRLYHLRWLDGRLALGRRSHIQPRADPCIWRSAWQESGPTLPGIKRGSRTPQHSCTLAALACSTPAWLSCSSVSVEPSPDPSCRTPTPMLMGKQETSVEKPNRTVRVQHVTRTTVGKLLFLPCVWRLLVPNYVPWTLECSLDDLNIHQKCSQYKHPNIKPLKISSILCWTGRSWNIWSSPIEAPFLEIFINFPS